MKKYRSSCFRLFGLILLFVGNLSLASQVRELPAPFALYMPQCKQCIAQRNHAVTVYFQFDPFKVPATDKGLSRSDIQSDLTAITPFVGYGMMQIIISYFPQEFDMETYDRSAAVIDNTMFAYVSHYDRAMSKGAQSAYCESRLVKGIYSGCMLVVGLATTPEDLSHLTTSGMTSVWSIRMGSRGLVELSAEEIKTLAQIESDASDTQRFDHLLFTGMCAPASLAEGAQAYPFMLANMMCAIGSGYYQNGRLVALYEEQEDAQAVLNQCALESLAIGSLMLALYKANPNFFPAVIFGEQLIKVGSDCGLRSLKLYILPEDSSLHSAAEFTIEVVLFFGSTAALARTKNILLTYPLGKLRDAVVYYPATRTIQTIIMTTPLIITALLTRLLGLKSP